MFDYATAPQIFLRREGIGPLHMAWDTNILVDYLQYGKALWGDESLGIENPEYASQVEAVGRIMDPLFCFWDIRIHLFGEILDDAKRELSIERRSEREHALERFARALMFADWSEESGERGDLESDYPQDSLFAAEELIQPLNATRQSLTAALPNGHDRILVTEAVKRGMHVFLTRDRGILRAAPLADRLGLLILSPVEFLQLFEESGLSALQFPAPDLARISKVIEALGSDW
ncbi:MULTISPECIES: hypothetical protein [Streptomyces]|uniref:hypothetical protein n=1 Tax=Streptomyces TaxID=1883 RepID=UPI00240E5134|nr:MULTISPECIES: hypothetical protein [Streptomyces]WFB87541.1 hypothetical protein MMU79_31860 [Streptomyces olivaceus]WGK47140.1 hypothetical protein M6G09_16965 [Streptomyces sp. B146]